MHFLTIRKFAFVLTIISFIGFSVSAQHAGAFNKEITDAIFKATKYFDEKISVNGGYVWFYSSDLSRRWGELEAYPTMAWVQGAGTVAMGHTFLNIYETSKDQYYYNLAEKSAYALIKGQLECGGWNYLIDFAGEKSLKKWYATIGKNAWRLEEFHHYYGNATFDDAATPGAASFLLRVYLIKNNPVIKSALDKAINFVLESQYENGAWPQRYPFQNCKIDNSDPGYTQYYTFNDNAIWNNINFLITCYVTLNEEKLFEPIIKAIDFYLLSQGKNPQAGWAQQYSLDLKPAAARSYEPCALDPDYSARHIEMLMKFYELTGDRKYIETISDAIEWIESVKISGKENGLYELPKFVELGSNKALFTHRKGTNIKCGKYFFDYENSNYLIHYQSIRHVNIKQLYEEVERVKLLSLKKIDNNFSISAVVVDKSNTEKYNAVQEFLKLNSDRRNWNRQASSDLVKSILSELDNEGRWFSKDVFISNPYIGEPECTDPDSEIYSNSRVGDKYDTSPYQNTSGQKYISTSTYMRNVSFLLKYLNQTKSNGK